MRAPGGCGPSSSAASISVTTPLPLSFRPGPSATESRWAPAITMRSARPPGVSAITFSVRRRCEMASTVSSPARRRHGFRAPPTRRSLPGCGRRTAERPARHAAPGQDRLRDDDRAGAGALGVLAPCRGRSRRRASTTAISRAPRPAKSASEQPAPAAGAVPSRRRSRSSRSRGTARPARGRGRPRSGTRDRACCSGMRTRCGRTSQPGVAQPLAHVVGRGAVARVPADRLPPVSSAIR